MMTDVLCSAEKHELVKKKIQHSALVLRFWKTAWIAAQIEFPCTPCNEVSPCRLYKAEAFSSILAYCWCLGTRLCCTSGSGVGVDQFKESRGERSERSLLLFESKTACSVQTPALEEEILLACEKWAGSCGMACQPALLQPRHSSAGDFKLPPVEICSQNQIHDDNWIFTTRWKGKISNELWKRDSWSFASVLLYLRSFLLCFATSSLWLFRTSPSTIPNLSEYLLPSLCWRLE